MQNFHDLALISEVDGGWTKNQIQVEFKCAIWSCKKDDTFKTCSICDEYCLKERFTTTTICKHTFHNYCLEGWLKRKNSCPNCRKDEPLVDKSKLRRSARLTRSTRITPSG